jgi:bifunctional ADP-heptose synthase (sugar kinase/adenylyltransferase)
VAYQDAIEKLIAADRASPKRIVVVGDAMQDEYVYGDLHDCQDGCKKFVERSRVTVPGGAAGAARQLSKWHCVVKLYANTHIPHTRKRYIANDLVVFRQDVNFSVDALSSVDRLIYAEPSAVLISDYNGGFLTDGIIRGIIRWCNENDVPVVADPKRHHNVFTGAVLKCNGDYSFGDLGVTHHSPACVVTHGAETPNVFSELGMLEDYGPLPPVTCRNHVGAGDCFAAHLTLALAHRIPLFDTAQIAHAAGRVYVQHPNGTPPRPEELLETL